MEIKLPMGRQAHYTNDNRLTLESAIDINSNELLCSPYDTSIISIQFESARIMFAAYYLFGVIITN